MTAATSKKEAQKRICKLVEKFGRHASDYHGGGYNEAQARTEFVSPLLEAFGWDVHNERGLPPGLREVIEESVVAVGDEEISKRPDYELRLARQRKLFVEAKKPAVRIESNRSAAFQARRYGYSASLPIVILTNFEHLAVYDCHFMPEKTDEAHVARMHLIRCDELEARLDEVWPLLSREEIRSGEFDRRFAIKATRHGSEQFDDFFLNQVQAWRLQLAIDIHRNVPGLSPEELTYVVQLFLLRLVFLRVCEDQEIERYGNLHDLTGGGSSFSAFMKELRRADTFYDSGLFRLLDDDPLEIRISDEVLSGIISELYYPQSPYTFAVVEAEILGEIYERFLGEVISITPDGAVTVETKPEVREGGGVVSTPRHVANEIVRRTLLPRVAGRSPKELESLTVADICCGSGIFLLAAFEFLMDHCLEWYLANDRETHIGSTILEVGAGQWRLAYQERRRILVKHLRGVDVDSNAVMVAGFSLLLKLIERDSEIGLREYVSRTGQRALPELDSVLRAGNSLVAHSEWESAVDGHMSPALVERINPFSWRVEFPEDFERGGFDVIVGNPPYVRIQALHEHLPEEVAFYGSSASPYKTARANNFDKYALFVERSLSLIRPDGRLGVIIPHKFMTLRSGGVLRSLLADGQKVEEIVHFGVQQVFGQSAATYTCIMILDGRGSPEVTLERVDALEPWRYGTAGLRAALPATALAAAPWQLADDGTRALFDRVRSACARTLDDAADIFVGAQTSADPIYIFDAADPEDDTVALRWKDEDWPIELGILRPCLHDAQLHPYAHAEANAWMIFPYEIVSDPRPMARLFQPDEMKRRFPLCLEYLAARRQELEGRSIGGGAVAQRQFYQFGRSQSLAQFDGPKIILPVLSREARYAIDEDDTVVTGGGNGPYYLLRPLDGATESIRFLLALLHHPLNEAMVRTVTSPFRGGYYSHGKQFIKDLPVPDAGDEQRGKIEELVGRLIDASDAARLARLPHLQTRHKRNVIALRAEVESCVNEIYGLSEDDVALARAVPVPE